MNVWGAQDMERRLANLIRIATITALDDTAAMARVTCAAVPESAWIPILTQRAGPDRSYWLPEPGEQVLILSPSGDPAQGMVLPAGFQSAYPPPADTRNVHRHEYADGTVTEYNRETSTLTVDCVGDIVVRAAGDLTAEIQGNVAATVGGTVTANANGAVSLTTQTSVTITAPITTVVGPMTVQGLLTYAGGMTGSGGGTTAQIQGNIVATGDIVGQGVSLKSHTHGGVESGGSSTGPPQ